ncbi:MAG: elongation factor G [Gammaproteobacteria bacterium RIFCSPLOWO2_12_FULL_47_76]|nr:MAG: elongation factor G [Gammaproteobacteria bacterium RIFCSPLOWO2_12_FULL_47_76]
MAIYSSGDIRNIALVGHGGAGKTTLVEALLYHAGAIKNMGSVEKGTAVCDFDPQEKNHQHSLDAAVVSMDYHGGHINLIDTPGYPDFIGRAMAVLPAVETCAVVINAQGGIEMTTHKMMQVAKERHMDRLIIINKIDHPDADLPALLNNIKETFGSECLPVNLPANRGNQVVDCFFQPQVQGVKTDFSSVEEAHTQIIDQVVELDEDLMQIYLEQGEEITPEQLHNPFEQALREDHLVPICFVSATTGAGVPELLELFARLMPNPMEGNPPQFLQGEGKDAKPFEISPDPERHALAHVFKVSIDPYAGKLGVFRIHQGRIARDSQLFIGDARKPFKVGHLLKLQGKQHIEIESAIPGDICAVAKVEEIHFDAVIHDSHEEDHIHLRSMKFPSPMCGLAIEVKSRGDEQKISDALHKLQAEDPSFMVEHHASLNETVIRGLGELHLRMILEKLKDTYNVEVETHPPRIAYRETITTNAEGHYRHKKQTGGAGQFGEVYLRIEPLPRGAGFEFVDDVVGGVIPRQYLPAIEKGVGQAVEQGVIAGYPLQDIRVTVYDGKYHTVDSKEVAFVSAGKKSFIEAVKKARPVVLEPVVNISIVTPNQNLGDITADLSVRRGRITDTVALSGGMTNIRGQVPLGEISSYQSQLKSITGGIGSFSIEFSHYDPVPGRKQQELITEFHPKEDEG